MKRVFRFIASALLAVMALQACDKTYIREITPKNDDKKQQDETVEEDDDISKLLKSLPGVSAVNIKTLAATGDTPAAKQYFFYYAQAIDHTDPQKGSFNQQVGIQISSDLKNPVILHTQGYAMSLDGTFFWNDHLRNYLDANWIEVEFRYFGQSQPEAMDNVQYSYLYSYQAAADLHEIVSLLKKNLFKESKWLATGASKGGITSGLQAYFSDKNGWKDIDVYVPFCAPFLPGTSASPLDSSMGKYVLTQCGAGYAEGTAEARGYANLQKILQASVSDKNLRDALLREFHAQYPDTYATIMSQMGGATEERMLAGVLNMFMETLLGRFSYTPFGQWAAFVPEADAYDKVVNFVFMSEDDFNKLVGGEEGGETKAIHTEAEMLELRNNPEADLPYGVQSVRELGCVGMDYSWLPADSFLTAATGYEVETAATGRYRRLDYYEGQWDGGQLMNDFLNWVAKETTQKLVFVYGSNDPWTGGAISDAAAQANPTRIVKVMNMGGIHDNAFLDENSYTPEARSQIQAAVKNFLQ